MRSSRLIVLSTMECLNEDRMSVRSMMAGIVFSSDDGMGTDAGLRVEYRWSVSSLMVAWPVAICSRYNICFHSGLSSSMTILCSSFI